MNRARGFFYLTLLLVGAGITTGAYQYLAKFLHDRESAMNFQRNLYMERFSSKARNKAKTYTPEELEKARQEGTLPHGVHIPQQQHHLQTNEQVQRTLKTIEDINKINEMNRRLMEQQRQIQNLR